MRKQKINYKKSLILLMILVCISILIYNTAILVRWSIDRNNIVEEIHELKEIEEIVEITDTEKVEFINPPKEELSDYWYYIKLPLTDVNVSELKNINSDTVGFLSISGTNINYPVVQTNNNDYYLTHSFKNKYNNAGWVFMDYRNNTNFNDRNTIVYGHGRLDSTVFGTLRNILNTSWVNNKDNYVIRYSTKEENMLFQVFSVYSTLVENYYIQTEFRNDNEYKKWVNTMIERSKFDFKTTINETDKIITLSTCKDDGKHRVVMHAKLIKKDTKQR